MVPGGIIKTILLKISKLNNKSGNTPSCGVCEHSSRPQRERQRETESVKRYSQVSVLWLNRWNNIPGGSWPATGRHRTWRWPVWQPGERSEGCPPCDEREKLCTVCNRAAGEVCCLHEDIRSLQVIFDSFTVLFLFVSTLLVYSSDCRWWQELMIVGGWSDGR